MAPFKRSKKLINSPLQLKMVAVFLGIGATTCLFQVVLLNNALTGLARDMPEVGDRLMRELPGIMLTNIGMSFGVLLPLMLAIGVVVTHRVAGPAYRMREHCRAIAAGEDPGPCRIRTDDELWDLCHALNDAVAHLRSREAESERATDTEAPAGRDAA